MMRHKWWCLMVALAIPSTPVWTADQPYMGDPTRPPASVLRAIAPSVGTPGGVPGGASAGMPGQAAVAASAPASAASAPKPRAPLPRLTSIRIDADGQQRVALLDGRAVTIGERVGEWVVSGIDTEGVTLRGARGLHRLALLPAADFGAAAEPSPAASGSEKETP
jgi:hypothetical protein